MKIINVIIPVIGTPIPSIQACQKLGVSWLFRNSYIDFLRNSKIVMLTPRRLSVSFNHALFKVIRFKICL